MNAICERLIGTLLREVRDRTLIEPGPLRAVPAEYRSITTPPAPIRASASVVGRKSSLAYQPVIW